MRGERFVCFTAEALQASNLDSFFLAIGRLVYVNGQSFDSQLEAILDVSNVMGIGRHTGLIVGHFDLEATRWTEATRYEWCHEKIRPLGHDLPGQCPTCGIALPWCRIAVKGSVRWAVCRSGCKSKEFSMVEGYEFCTSAFKGGRWLRKRLL